MLWRASWFISFQKVADTNIEKIRLSACRTALDLLAEHPEQEQVILIYETLLTGLKLKYIRV